MSTPITLRVNVVDTLEGAPIFTQEVYSVSIAEGNYTLVSTWLLTLKYKHLFPQSSRSMEFRQCHSGLNTFLCNKLYRLMKV